MRRAAAIGLVALSLVPAALSAPRYGEAEVAQLTEIAASEKEPEARRAMAIRELANTRLRSQMGLLRRLMREERSLDIRLAAACTLAALGDRRSPRDLLLATAYDAEATPSCSRSDVLIALARTGDPAAEIHLERALQAEPPAAEPFYYSDVCRALVILNTPGARSLLLTALRDGRVELRKAAVSPLASAYAALPSASRLEVRQALLLAARSDPEEEVAEQAASALLWSGVDGPGFFALLERDPEPVVRARAARAMNRHYLSAPRLARLKQALAAERDDGVRAELQRTVDSQLRR
jgi:HEAT repeat protein